MSQTGLYWRFKNSKGETEEYCLCGLLYSAAVIMFGQKNIISELTIPSREKLEEYTILIGKLIEGTSIFREEDKFDISKLWYLSGAISFVTTILFNKNISRVEFIP